MTAELLFFFVLAFGVLVSSLLVVLFRNPINSAVALVATFLQLAGVYALLSAPFLAIIQVMVYAGAIMVLFLFVIMLLNLSDEELGERKVNITKFVAGLATLGVLAAFVASIVTLQDKPPVQVSPQMSGQTLSLVLGQSLSRDKVSQTLAQGVLVDGQWVNDGAMVLKDGQNIEFASTPFPGLQRHARVPGQDELRRLHMTKQELGEEGIKPFSKREREILEERVAKWDRFGSVEAVGSLLYTKWLFPFQITALLLLAAIPGAVVLAKRRLQ